MLTLAVMMREVMGEAIYQQEIEKKKEHLMRDFFKDEIDRIQQQVSLKPF